MHFLLQLLSTKLNKREYVRSISITLHACIVIEVQISNTRKAPEQLAHVISTKFDERKQVNCCRHQRRDVVQYGHEVLRLMHDQRCQIRRRNAALLQSWELTSYMVRTFRVSDEISSSPMMQSYKRRSCSSGQPISSCSKKPWSKNTFLRVILPK